MSCESLCRAWRIPMPAAPKLVLLSLADVTGAEGVGFLRVSDLPRKCGLTPSEVRDAIGWLASYGFLTVERDDLGGDVSISDALVFRLFSTASRTGAPV